MKTLLTMVSFPDWHKDDPTPDSDIKLMYAVWSTIARRRGFEIHKAAAPWYKDGYFTKSWRYNPRGFWEKSYKKIKPTLIYDRGIGFDRVTGEPNEQINAKKALVAQKIPMFIQPVFTRLVDNKLYQAAIFRDVMTRTFFAPKGTRVKQKRKQKVVVKALGGLGGNYVKITDSKNIVVPQQSIVQEFIDARVDDAVRDFRIHFVGNQPQYFYTRVAPVGSLYTNVHLGASFYWIKPSDHPQIWALAQQIVKRLTVFPKKFFAIDFMVDAKSHKPILIEINSMPGTNEFTVNQHEHLLNNMTNHMFGWEK